VAGRRERGNRRTPRTDADGCELLADGRRLMPRAASCGY
jgi:hypothetical protein